MGGAKKGPKANLRPFFVPRSQPSSTVLVVPVVLVDDGVALAAGDEVPVDREGRDERHRKRESEATPEQEAAEPSVHRAGDHEDD